MRIGSEVSRAIAAGAVVCIFPEGTSSDGSDVLPFRPALFQPAIDGDWPITAACIGYQLKDGSVADEVCYWGDMTLLPHLLNLFSKREIRSKCSFSLPKIRAGDRKGIATELREEIVSMRS